MKALRTLFASTEAGPDGKVVDATVLAFRLLGLSLIAERFDAAKVYHALAVLTTELEQTVRDFGGHLEHTFGNGFASRFSDVADGKYGNGSHADRAFKCAMQIQKNNVARVIAAGRHNEPVLCLRIGAHTGRVYFGNLPAGIGGVSVGHCVDLAGTVAETCEVHSIMVSKEVRDLFVEVDAGSESFKPRVLAVRKDQVQFDAFEFDPFEAELATRREAMEALRTCTKLERLDHRWPVTVPAALTIVTSHGPARSLNFSRGGIALVLQSTLPVGTGISLSIDTPDGRLKDRLARCNMAKIQGEVRWVAQKDNVMVTGVQYRDLRMEQLEFLLSLLLETQGHGRQVA